LFEKPTENSTVLFVLTTLKNLIRRPAIKFGLARDSRSRFRNPGFASFMSQRNNKLLNTDLQDAVLRGRRWVKQGLWLVLFAGVAWIALESAKALSIF